MGIQCCEHADPLSVFLPPPHPTLSPLMGARESGLDEDRYLSRVQPSQNSTAAPGIKMGTLLDLARPEQIATWVQRVISSLFTTLLVGS